MNIDHSTNKKNTDTINIYFGPVLNDVSTLFFLGKILNKNSEAHKNLWNMFQGIDGEASLDFLHITQDPRSADFYLVPHDYYLLKKTKNLTLLSPLIALAKSHNKKILIFAMADSDEYIDVPHSVIFRYSQYGYKKKKNEIITPPYTLLFKPQGLEAYREKIWENLILREKKEIPTVSFHGWADFPNWYRHLTYGARIGLANIKRYLLRDLHAGLHKPGIYFRRKAVQALSQSKHIQTDFLMRKSFFAKSGFDGKISINPEVVEKTYIQSILNSDFVLAPKGSGNASLRFFETLSLGRFPVLIDTDYVLPLKDHIDYKKFLVTVDYTRIKDTERTILDFYNSVSSEEFKERQKMAREAFKLLRPGVFLRIVLSELKQAYTSYKI